MAHLEALAEQEDHLFAGDSQVMSVQPIALKPGSALACIERGRKTGAGIGVERCDTKLREQQGTP